MRSKKKFLYIAGLVVLVGGFWLISRLSSTTSQGIVSAPQTQPLTATPAKPIGQTGQYISFKYPGNFTKIPSSKPTGSEIEAFDYLKRPSPFWYLSIGVSNLPSGSLADDGSYNSRQKDPARYDHQHWQTNNGIVDVFSDKTAPYAKSTFIAHKNLILSVALTADSSDPRLDPDLLNIINSIQWLKD